MKCDELEKFDATSNAERSAGIESRYAYDADEVDEAIEEFKEVYKESVDVKVKIWERCKNLEEQNAQLKRGIDHLQSKVAAMVTTDNSAVIARLEAENAKLKSCIKCLVIRDLIKDCPEKKSAIEIVKDYK